VLGGGFAEAASVAVRRLAKAKTGAYVVSLEYLADYFEE